MESKLNDFTDIDKALTLFKQGDPDAAFDHIDEALKDNPNNVPALLLATTILDKARRLTTAYQFAGRCIELAPHMPECWTNFGRISEELYQLEDAERAYKKAIQLSVKPRTLALNLNNLSSFYATTGQWKLAEKTAKECLEIEPESKKAKGNLGIAQLATHQWKEGWPNYGEILGSDQRRFVKYRDEPEWNGEPDKTVVIYGEQGLGDELSFASMLPDAIKISKKVIVDCDERLVGLFKRSFPKAKIYGTRWKKEIDWDEEDQHPDYSISIGQLGRIFRNSDRDFTGEPYLVPDRERHVMWREYFKVKPTPVIGIAWSGGLDWTAKRFRKWELHELQPLFDSVNAHWVSLQYKDASEEINGYYGAQISQYPFATLSKDYDETAGLVSACDLVICMQTSVGHLSAAMGIETWAFVNSTAPQWRYGEGDTVPWYRAMHVFRQRVDKSWPIDEAARILQLRYSGHQLKSA